MTDTFAHENADTAAVKGGVSRRQLVKAGAWAAPAIVLTTAVPAASASGTRSVQVLSLASGQTGPWTDITVRVRNDNAVESATVTVSLTASGGITLVAPTTRTLVIPAGGTADFTGFGRVSTGNNGQGHTITATATVASGWSAGTALTVGIRGGRAIPYAA